MKLAIVAAAGLLVGGSAAPALAAEPLPPDLELVPRDAMGFVAARVSDVAGALEKLLANEPSLSGVLKELDKRGLPASQIERAVAVLGRNSTVIVTLAKPLDKAKVQDSLVPHGKEKKAGGKTYLADTDKDTALYVVNDRTILVGPVRGVEEHLQGLAAARGTALDAALAVAAGKHFFVLGLNPDKVGKDVPPNLKPFESLLQARGVAVMDLEEKAWGCKVRLAYDSEDAATAGEKTGQMVLDLLKAQVPQAIAAMAKLPANSPQKAATETIRQVLEEVDAGLKEAKVTRAGKVVEGTMRVSSEDPRRAGALLLQAVGGTIILLQSPPERPRPVAPKPPPEKPPSR
jgi:hypothetical protein